PLHDALPISTFPSARAAATASGDQGVSAAASPDGPVPGASDAADAVTAAAASKDNVDAAVVPRAPRPAIRAICRQPHRVRPNASNRPAARISASASPLVWRANTQTSQSAAPYIGKARIDLRRSIHGPGFGKRRSTPGERLMTR